MPLESKSVVHKACHCIPLAVTLFSQNHSACPTGTKRTWTNLGYIQAGRQNWRVYCNFVQRPRKTITKVTSRLISAYGVLASELNNVWCVSVTRNETEEFCSSLCCVRDFRAAVLHSCRPENMMYRLMRCIDFLIHCFAC